MNLGIRKVFNGVLSTVTKFQYTPIRNRYWSEKVAKGHAVKKFGYKDNLFKGGVLPRLKTENRIPVKEYTPVNAWNKDKTIFGQNDYIDILGGGKIRPFNVCYNVPKWLRGVKGHEFRLLVLKQKMFKTTKYVQEHPTSWEKLNKRIRYLYKFLNRKTKTQYMRD